MNKWYERSSKKPNAFTESKSRGHILLCLLALACRRQSSRTPLHSIIFISTFTIITTTSTTIVLLVLPTHPPQMLYLEEGKGAPNNIVSYIIYTYIFYLYKIWTCGMSVILSHETLNIATKLHLQQFFASILLKFVYQPDMRWFGMDLVNAACVHGLLNNSWPTRLVRVSGCFCGLGKVADNILVV